VGLKTAYREKRQNIPAAEIPEPKIPEPNVQIPKLDFEMPVHTSTDVEVPRSAVEVDEKFKRQAANLTLPSPSKSKSKNSESQRSCSGKRPQLRKLSSRCRVSKNSTFGSSKV